LSHIRFHQAQKQSRKVEIQIKMAATAAVPPSGAAPTPPDTTKRKRKGGSGNGSGSDDDGDDYSDNKSLDPSDKERLARNVQGLRESHCEIERRRRSKMATYVNELCDMVPACSTLARKPDKLTILRLAVAHM